MSIDPFAPLGRTVDVEGRTFDVVTHTELRFDPSGAVLLVLFHDETELAAVLLSTDETAYLGAAFTNFTAQALICNAFAAPPQEDPS